MKKAIILFAFISSLWGATAVASSNELQIEERSRGRYPGEVLFLTVSSGEQLQSLRAEGLGRKFRGFESGSGEWKLLVGIDLNLKPGGYDLAVSAQTVGGQKLTEVYPVVVETKDFPTRRLTVDPKFVNPPQGELERIRAESRRLGAIFATVNEGPFWGGGFVSPVPGAATSGFGKRSILNGQPRSPHSGTDFDADQGTPVRSPNGGRVVLVADLYYTGQTVVVDHGLGLYSLFAHLSGFETEEGEMVEPNQVVGLVGSTGRVTGPHLHWTVRLGTARVDPLSLIEVTSDR